MRTLILILALPTAALASPAPRPENAPPRCESHTAVPASGQVEAQFRRLDELPPANLTLTVVRMVDGCAQPVVLRTGISATSPMIQR